MTRTDADNRELQLARELVHATGSHVFLTGKAGTGKTTFLHSLHQESDKRMVVTAPTGVAAINAGGVTLHSFFQLPFGPFVPGSNVYGSDSQRQFRFSKEKKQIIQSLDLLVIDEISMVRADLLDAVDAALRRHRRSSEPFGGVQLLMIGDLHQLPPVVKREEWALLQEHYESAYFFSSLALQKTSFIPLELKRIYRQSDPAFIELLNRVRDNSLDNAALDSLNQRHIPDFAPDREEGFITLTTHNRHAEAINQARMKKLHSREHCFEAKVSGDFPEHLSPVPASLVLKKGAQVMFVRNDTSPEKRFYNGMIGRVRSISEKGVSVVCPEDRQEIRVESMTWENIAYQLDEETRDLERKVVGTFEQVPLKPAWAITIHKSQGLTFEKAVIEAGDAFAHGQVYVALSRCASLDGVVLSSPLSPRGLNIDPAVRRFTRHVRDHPPTEEQLKAAKTGYQHRLLLECFDFSPAGRQLRNLVQNLLASAGRVRVSGVSDLRQLEQDAGEVFRVSGIFQRELRSMFLKGRLPEEDSHIQDRVRKGSAWFQSRLKELLIDPLQQLGVETDNAELGKRIGQDLDRLKKELAVRQAGIQSCEDGFSPSRYLRAVSKARIDSRPARKKTPPQPEYTDSDIAHPELYQSLKDWRARMAKEQDISPHQVLHLRTLIQIAVHLPDTLDRLKAIRGVGKRTVEKYGREIVDVVSDYRRRHSIEGVDLPESSSETFAKQNEQPATTREISLEMFQKGLTVERIAQERGLARSTVEGHLGTFVERGDLDINELLTQEQQEAIARALAEEESDSLRSVKDRLGEGYSYGQIKMVLAHQQLMSGSSDQP